MRALLHSELLETRKQILKHFVQRRERAFANEQRVKVDEIPPKDRSKILAACWKAYRDGLGALLGVAAGQIPLPSSGELVLKASAKSSSQADPTAEDLQPSWEEGGAEPATPDEDLLASHSEDQPEDDDEDEEDDD